MSNLGPDRERVILLHGLWMRGFSMLALQHALLDAGFAVRGFEYASVVEQPKQSLTRLRQMMRSLAGKRGAPSRVHLIGHSLGGIVALQSVINGEDLPDGRIVCLGTPLGGSSAARGFAHWPVGQMLFGHSARALLDGVPAWAGEREVGVIAGSAPHGLGVWFGRFDGVHDGTVAVAETHLPGISDHCVVHASHTGLLFSNAAARQAIAFLRRGRFDKQAEAAMQ